MNSNFLASLSQVLSIKENIIDKLCPSGPKCCCKFNTNRDYNLVLARLDEVYTSNLYTGTYFQKKTEIIIRMINTYIYIPVGSEGNGQLF